MTVISVIPVQRSRKVRSADSIGRRVRVPWQTTSSCCGPRAVCVCAGAAATPLLSLPLSAPRANGARA